jgi:phosphatidate cytidylyltransferase
LVAVFQLTPILVAYIYVVVAVFDGFSQVVGQYLGRYRLVPSISPNKTIEGAFGGAVVAASIAVLTRSLVTLNSLEALLTGLLICIAALGGDLSASWLKRKAGIKDYDRLFPGHGGVLDRFDSFLFVLAICGLWLA